MVREPKNRRICLGFVHNALAKEADLVASTARFSLPLRPDSVATLKEEMDFKAYAEGYGMQASWLCKAFQRGNFTFKVAGLKISDPDMCVVLQRPDGARSQENGKLAARYLGEAPAHRMKRRRHGRLAMPALVVGVR